MATLHEALMSYRQGSFERNKPMAEFCGVNYRTALEWGRKRDPKGEPLNKLWFFLEAHGEIVDGLNKLDPVTRYLGKLVAFGVLSAQEALDLLELDGPPQYLWRVLQGKSKPYRIADKSITRQMLGDHYDRALDKAYAKFSDTGLIPPKKERRQSKLPAKPEIRSGEVGTSSLVIIAAAMVSGLKPLLEVVLQNPQGAEALRKAVGPDNFHDVLDLMKSAASRKAHQFYHGEKERR